jgi:hypothetical protein
MTRHATRMLTRPVSEYMYNYTWQDNQLESATQTQAVLPREVTLTTALANILQNSTATLSKPE